MGRRKRTNTAGIVYLISFPNGKNYVGITTTSFDERKASHISHMNTSNLAVHGALKKYFGQENWKIVAKGDSWEELTKLEVKFIQKYNSYIDDNGYNLTLGGDGASGYKLSDEQKLMHSKLKKKYFSNDENRLKQSKATRLVHQNKPHLAQEHSAFSKQRFTDKKERGKVSEGMKNYLSEKENLRVHSIQRGAKPFLVTKKGGKIVGEWLTQNSCARDLNLNVGHINKCLHGKRKTHKGYTFSYVS